MTLQHDAPAFVSLNMQPRPVSTRVVHGSIGAALATAIYREWGDGDAARCRLCSRCTAHDDGCLKLVADHIPLESAPLFAARDLAEWGGGLAEDLPPFGLVKPDKAGIAS